jgi:hypothetical protein
MATKKDNKKHKNSVEEVSLDDLDLDILKEVGITDEEIENFNKDKTDKTKEKNTKDLKKKEKKKKLEKILDYEEFEEKIPKLDDEIENEDDFFGLEEDDEDDFLGLDSEFKKIHDDIKEEDEFGDIALSLRKDK